MSKRKVSREKVKELYQLGLTDREIAKKLHCAILTVRMIRYELGLTKKYRKDIGKKIIALYKKGLKPSEIAYRLKCTPQQVYITTLKTGLRKPTTRRTVIKPFLNALQSGPKFASELKAIGITSPHQVYRTALIHGYAVKRFRLPPTSRAAKHKQREYIIYYFERDKHLAFARLLKIPNVRNINYIARAMQI